MPRETAFDETAILERARNLFWEKGYTATSIQDLEAALGIRRSSIYNTFGGKRQLYDRTLAQYQEENLSRLRTALLNTPDLRAALITLFTQAASQLHPECLTSSRGCYIVNATTEMANSCADALTFVSDNREQFTTILHEALAGSQVRGQLDKDADPMELADFLFLCYNGLQVVVQTRIERPALLRSVTRCINSLPWT
ncbi:HTH-type transcriptional repressor ComR [Neolewinella maritima]|uniref:HTH-type transcriptional repressor ComR n=1 Tax=Neolewinella maritima TaxID=1383882 RepID=A0ABM9AXN8_9BACT|nr:TetR/AcrR family transcriptional regulator [Neolewinella maritima]CAH0998994.1 HTH-type transcriptional repressor ComR [Neolewinella maritima]